MYQFIESIKLLDGKFYRLELHQERINQIFNTFFQDKEKIDLSKVFEKQCIPSTGLFKTRIVFDEEVRILEFIPYQLPKINSLKIVETDIETTFYKSADREKINHAFSKKEDCDDILFMKNKLITDTSYCNVAFFDGENWFTPKVPLIYGTQRKRLIENKLVVEKDILLSNMKNFQSISLFNAMIEFKDLIIPTESIKI